MLIRVAESGDAGVVVALRYTALSANAPSVYSAQELGELLDDLDVDELRAMIKRSAAVRRRDRWTHRRMRRLARHVPSTRLCRHGRATRRSWDPLGSSCRVRPPEPDIRSGNPCRLGDLRPAVLREARLRASNERTLGKRAFLDEEDLRRRAIAKARASGVATPSRPHVPECRAAIECP